MTNKEDIFSSGVTFEQYADCVFDWASKRGIIPENGATVEGQLKKLQEEVGEVIDAISGGDLRATQLEIGDVQVVLLILCRLLNVDLVECLKLTYEKIEKRTGVLKDGVFVKEVY